MRMAKYYDGIEHYGSAKEYYAIVIKKYPDTEMAKKAKDRMGAIASYPEEPSKPLGSVVGLFPKSAEHASMAKVPELKNGILIGAASRCRYPKRYRRGAGSDRDANEVVGPARDLVCPSHSFATMCSSNVQVQWRHAQANDHWRLAADGCRLRGLPRRHAIARCRT